jgi:hypothetical protein
MISQIDKILLQVREEVYFATEKFGVFASPHEGYAIIKEELDELWDDIKANRGYEFAAEREAIQVAAMAIRYLLDISRRKGIDTQ